MGGRRDYPIFSWKGPWDSRVKFPPARAAMPPCLAPQVPFKFRKFQGFVALAIVLRAALGSGADLWLAVPNVMAEPLGLAGIPDAGDVPVEAPGPSCFQR